MTVVAVDQKQREAGGEYRRRGADQGSRANTNASSAVAISPAMRPMVDSRCGGPLCEVSARPSE
jgi:hypothetical protein